MSTALFDLSGRTALVTGSSRGLGRAIAEGMAKAGAKIIVNGVDPKRVEAFNATHNIAASVRAAASGTADVAVNVRNAAKGANETGETSSRMFASAQTLSGESLHLKAEVDGFLDRVHAA